MTEELLFTGLAVWQRVRDFTGIQPCSGSGLLGLSLMASVSERQLGRNISI